LTETGQHDRADPPAYAGAFDPSQIGHLGQSRRLAPAKPWILTFVTLPVLALPGAKSL
jgi:hypothetical protein